MPYCSISIHRYSGTSGPKIFSGNKKDKVIEAFREYVEDHEETFKNDCYIKVTKDDITVLSHERDPMEALKDACTKLYTEIPEVKFSNMAVIVDEEVDINGDDLDEVEEEVNEKDMYEEVNEIDPDDVPDDMKIDGEIITGDWDGLIEDED